MQISSTNGYNFNGARGPRRKPVSKYSAQSGNSSPAQPISSEKKDRYIHDSHSVQAHDLSEIRARIKSGFYNTDVVNEDLSEAFSNLFTD
ncbi:MAG: hypothetical protein ACQEQ4_02900 [Fibrobacterota bacterium]